MLKLEELILIQTYKADFVARLYVFKLIHSDVFKVL